MTALMLATKHGHKAVVKVLLENKANPNIMDKVGLCLYGAYVDHKQRKPRHGVPYTI